MDIVICCDFSCDTTNTKCLFIDGPAREHSIVDALDNGDNITAKVHTTPTNHIDCNLSWGVCFDVQLDILNVF